MLQYIPEYIFYRIYSPNGTAEVSSTKFAERMNAKKVKNEPIEGVSLAGLTAHGIKADFKVGFSIEGRRCVVEITNEELLDITQHEGIIEGEILVPLIWVGGGKIPRLTRIGSPTHREYQRKQILANEKPISKEQLIVGKVYETPGRRKGVYLGGVNTTKFIPAVGHYELMKCKVLRDQMLWLEWLPEEGIDEPDPIAFISQPTKLLASDKEFKLVVKASHSFKICLEEMIDVPTNIVELLSTTLLEELERKILIDFLFSWDLCDCSAYFNMVPVDKEPTVSQRVLHTIESFNTTKRGPFTILDFITLEELPALLTSKNEEVRKAATEWAEELGVEK